MTSKAVGLIETIGLAAAIEAADAAVKAANVTLLGYEYTKGEGMITVKVVGDVGAVKAAVSAGTTAAFRIGQVKSCHVIPRPHHEIETLIKQIDRGPAAEKAKEEKPKAARPKSEPQKKTTAKAEKPAEAISTTVEAEAKPVEQPEQKPKPAPKRRRPSRKKTEPKPVEPPKPEEPPVEPPKSEEPPAAPVESEEPKPSE